MAVVTRRSSVRGLVSLAIALLVLPRCGATQDDVSALRDAAEVGAARDAALRDGAPFEDALAPPPDARTDAARDVKRADAVDCEAHPGAFLCPCRDNADCESLYCVPVGDGSQSVCSRICTEDCPEGWFCKGVLYTWPDVVFICVPAVDRSCHPCATDQSCAAEGDRCLPVGEGEGRGAFCLTACGPAGECRPGYRCEDGNGEDGGALGRYCRPETGSCVCTPDLLGTKRPCRRTNIEGTCFGEERCDGAPGWVGCTAAEPAAERCNQRDDDCDGAFDEDFAVVDWDTAARAIGESCGTGLCAGGRVACDGPDAAVCSTAAQAAAEVCNGIDDDCDGDEDEGLLRVFYRDADGDQHGHTLSTTLACLAPEGYVAAADDCDDEDDRVAPGLPELCDGKDNGCDGETDEAFGWTPPGATTPTALGAACGSGLCAGGVVVCADLWSATCSTLGQAAPETCDDVDESCDGREDDGCDDDGDGWCDADLDLVGQPAVCPDGGGDCDDADDDVHPDADERCNGGDDDCDGATDESVVDCPSFSCVGSGDVYFETGVATCEDGECVSPDAVSCGLYTCDGGRCATACSADRTCTAAAHCDEATGTCVGDLGPGGACLEASDCAAGLYCRNGFCCGASGGDCCSAPGDCPATYGRASACDAPANCQGTRREALCENAVCATSAPIPDDTGCTGETLALDCAPYLPVHCTGAADQAPPACASGCAGDAHCRPGYHCDDVCRPDVADGGACDEPGDCASGHCQNGFCCPAGDCCAVAADCPAAYRRAPTCGDAPTCQGTRVDARCDDSVCEPSPPLADDSACGPETVASLCGSYPTLYCTGAANQVPPECPAACAADAECDPAAHCDGTCQPDASDGAVCDEDSDCASGHCGGGLCCAAGDCCNVPAECAALGYGEPPVCADPAACQGTVVAAVCRDRVCGTEPGTPDDSACAATTLAQTCGLYPARYCTGEAAQPAPVCAESCAEDRECVAAAHCDGAACVADLPPGAPCDEPSDCAGGHCQNGFCCPGGDCCGAPADCPPSYRVAAACTDPARCQGSRRDATCEGSVCGTSALLDDDSGCGAGVQSKDCTPFVPVYCTGEPAQVEPVCGASCTLDAECLPGYHCDGTCQPDRPDGLSCDEPSDCLSDHCQNGFCCGDGDCCGGPGDCPAAYRAAPVCDAPATCQGHRVDATCVSQVCGSTGSIEDDSGCGPAVLVDECGPYAAVSCSGAVDQTPPGCPTACAHNVECDPDAHCDDVCTPDLPDGSPCDEHSDCAGAHCQNGFCCPAGDCCATATDCAAAAWGLAPACDDAASCQGRRRDPVCEGSVCAIGPYVDDDSGCAGREADGCGLYAAVYCSAAPDQATPSCPGICATDAGCDAGAHCDAPECLADGPAGTPCDEASDCQDALSCGSNGYCCGVPGGTCCATDADCAAFTTPAVCDAPATCTGHRVEGACDGDAVCRAVQLAAPEGCQGALCSPGRYCAGATIREDRYCDAAGGCTSDGALIQNCQGSNSCCDYGCSGASCTSAFRSGDLGCALACLYQPVFCFCW